MGLISGLIIQGSAELIGGSKTKSLRLLSIDIAEKHRNYLKTKNKQNEELEGFIKKNSKSYYKNLKKL